MIFPVQGHFRRAIDRRYDFVVLPKLEDFASYRNVIADTRDFTGVLEAAFAVGQFTCPFSSGIAAPNTEYKETL